MAVRPPQFLRHIHIPNNVPYQLAQRLQSHFFQQQLSYKAALTSHNSTPTSRIPSTPPPLPPPPPPTILTFSPDPVYTLGRRESLSTLSPSQLRNLRAPLLPSPTSPSTSSSHTPLVQEVSRGGQTTFHGPGQLVIYPILDIKTSFPRQRHGFSVRCYVHFLEEVTIRTLDRWRVSGVRTENPGVWAAGGERKVAALGVHLRRNVSSYGVGLNVQTDLRWFDRIVACGLEGKGATSMHELLRGTADRGGQDDGELPSTDQVAQEWVGRFAEGLWGEGEYERIRRMGIDDLVNELHGKLASDLGELDAGD